MKKLYSCSQRRFFEIVLSYDIIIVWYYETTETLISRSNKRFYIRRIDWKVRRSPTNFPTKLSWKAKTCGPPSTRMFLSFKYQRGLSSTGELPDLVRIHAYARTRVHAIISRALRKVLHPSRRLALAPAPSRALSRDKYLYTRTPAARYCGIRIGYSCSD